MIVTNTYKSHLKSVNGIELFREEKKIQEKKERKKER